MDYCEMLSASGVPDHLSCNYHLLVPGGCRIAPWGVSVRPHRPHPLHTPPRPDEPEGLWRVVSCWHAGLVV